MALPVLTKERYLSQIDAWAFVYTNQYDDDPGPFLCAYRTVRQFIHALKLPAQGTAEEFCTIVQDALNMHDTDPVARSWSSIQIPVWKSACLDRLLYCNEDLRIQPCPKHKGRWRGPAWGDPCECGDTGWLPNG